MTLPFRSKAFEQTESLERESGQSSRRERGPEVEHHSPQQKQEQEGRHEIEDREKNASGQNSSQPPIFAKKKKRMAEPTSSWACPPERTEIIENLVSGVGTSISTRVTRKCVVYLVV